MVKRPGVADIFTGKKTLIVIGGLVSKFRRNTTFTPIFLKWRVKIQLRLEEPSLHKHKGMYQNDIHEIIQPNSSS